MARIFDDEEKELLAEFIDEAMDSLDDLDSMFVTLESDPSEENISSIFRPVHTIKGNAAYFEMEKLTELTHKLETLLNAVDSACVERRDTSAWIDLMACIRVLKEEGRGLREEPAGGVWGLAGRNATRRRGGGRCGNPCLTGAAPAASQDFRAAEARAGRSARALSLEPPRAASRRQGRAPHHARTRGEYQRFSQPGGRTRCVGRDVRPRAGASVSGVGRGSRCGRAVARQRILRNHFERAAEGNHVRALVPIRATLQKAPRIVRDIATKKRKQIEVEVIGEDIEVDKSHVGVLEGPITHMIRNAADHGIELPDDRVRAGKPRVGPITLAVTTTEDMLYLTVKDDGAGLDLDALRDKARSLGLIRPDQPLTHDATVKLLFSSGVSTAKEVTEVSGRGVGMDAVRRDVEAAGGRISVTTEPGKGTTFTVQLPRSVTTQIIDAFVVAVGDGFYVIPIERVAESFAFDKNALLRLNSGRYCVKRHDSVLAIVDLAELFKSEPLPDLEEGIFVAVENQGKPLALRVDRIVGTQQVVVKALDMVDIEPNVFAGCAVMGDGEIALVLEVDSLSAV